MSEERDTELAEAVAGAIQTTCETLHRALNQNRHEEVVQLSGALRDQAAAYQDLREISA